MLVEAGVIRCAEHHCWAISCGRPRAALERESGVGWGNGLEKKGEEVLQTTKAENWCQVCKKMAKILKEGWGPILKQDIWP